MKEIIRKKESKWEARENRKREICRVCKEIEQGKELKKKV